MEIHVVGERGTAYYNNTSSSSFQRRSLSFSSSSKARQRDLCKSIAADHLQNEEEWSQKPTKFFAQISEPKTALPARRYLCGVEKTMRRWKLHLSVMVEPQKTRLQFLVTYRLMGLADVFFMVIVHMKSQKTISVPWRQLFSEKKFCTNNH